MIQKSLKTPYNTLHKYYLNIVYPNCISNVRKSSASYNFYCKILFFPYFDNLCALGSPASVVWPQG